MKQTDAREQGTAANHKTPGTNRVTLCESPDRSSDCDEIDGIRTSGRPSEGAKRPLSRLQKRAPASLQLKSLQDSFLLSSSENNRSPIPLLSPLVTSPLPELWAEQSDREDKEEEKRDVAPFVGNLPVDGWQHPAAPFFCDKACSFPFLPIKLF